MNSSMLQFSPFGELRLSNFGSHSEKGPEWSIGSFQWDRADPSQRTITFGIDTAACKTVGPSSTPQPVGI